MLGTGCGLASQRGATSVVGRRSLLAGGLGATAWLLLPKQGIAEDAGEVSTDPEDMRGVDLFERLAGRAEALAREGYDPPNIAIADSLRSLSPKAYDSIRLRPEFALFSDGRPFSVWPRPVGHHAVQPVRLMSVRQGELAPVSVDPTMFDFGQISLPPEDVAQATISGLSVMAALENAGKHSSVAVFDGVGTIQARSEGSVFGAGARGVTVDTALPRGEEFPPFTAFWLVPPHEGDTELTLLGLLNGPSLTGAYRFRLRPGDTTRLNVRARLFARRPIDQIGLAPLTGMYAFGGIDRNNVDDYRPRVHSVEGLALHTGGGEFLWRPLQNPDSLALNMFMDENPRRFGLLQRQRGLTAYNDLQARYDLAPGVWVTPHGRWGRGSVRLVEIPSADEANDNVVAFWTPESPFTPDAPLEVSYSVHWSLDDPGCPLARTVSSSAGRWDLSVTDGEGGEDTGPGQRLWVVDFVGGDLAQFVNPTALSVRASVDRGRFLPPKLIANPDTGGVRVLLTTEADGTEPINLRLALYDGDAPVSETWTFQWDPPEGG